MEGTVLPESLADDHADLVLPVSGVRKRDDAVGGRHVVGIRVAQLRYEWNSRNLISRSERVNS